MKKDANDSGFAAPLAQQQRPLLMAQLFRAFLWFDRHLQDHLAARGWAPVSRSASQIMLLVATGATRQKDLADLLGISPQAVNQSIAQLADKGLINLTPDPKDRRQKIIELPDQAGRMMLDAMAILTGLEAEVQAETGERNFEKVGKGLEQLISLEPGLDDQAVSDWAGALLRSYRD